MYFVRLVDGDLVNLYEIRIVVKTTHTYKNKEYYGFLGYRGISTDTQKYHLTEADYFKVLEALEKTLGVL